MAMKLFANISNYEAERLVEDAILRRGEIPIGGCDEHQVDWGALQCALQPLGWGLKFAASTPGTRGTAWRQAYLAPRVARTRAIAREWELAELAGLGLSRDQARRARSCGAPWRHELGQILAEVVAAGPEAAWLGWLQWPAEPALVSGRPLWLPGPAAARAAWWRLWAAAQPAEVVGPPRLSVPRQAALAQLVAAVAAVEDP